MSSGVLVFPLYCPCKASFTDDEWYQCEYQCNEAGSLKKHMRMLLISIPQSVSPWRREKRESKRHQSRDCPTQGMVLYGVAWYSMVPPNNHTSRLINHYSCHLAKLIHRIHCQNPCDNQFNPTTLNCPLLSEEEPDHYCHRFSSFSKLDIS